MPRFTYRRLTFNISNVRDVFGYTVIVSNSRHETIFDFSIKNDTISIDRCNAVDEEDVYACMTMAWRKEQQQRARASIYQEFKRQYLK